MCGFTFGVVSNDESEYPELLSFWNLEKLP